MNRLLRYYLSKLRRKTYCWSKILSVINDFVLIFIHRNSISSIPYIIALIKSKFDFSHLKFDFFLIWTLSLFVYRKISYFKYFYKLKGNATSE